jgi:probable addiction module antidote protein
MALAAGRFGAMPGQLSQPPKLHRSATANDRLRVAEPRALAMRVPQGDIDVNTVPDLDTAIAVPARTTAAATPRVKLSSRGFAIDHPDPELGEQLMAAALGVADRDAMHGILRQLVRASVNGRKPDPANLAFMISMVESIRPRSMPKTRVFDAAEFLDSPEMVAEYLTEALETDDEVFIAKAIGTVARAQGMGAVADSAGVSRENLYRALSGTTRPEFETIRKVLGALGVQLVAKPRAV